MEDAQEFLKLIKKKDADKLLQLLNKSDPTRLDIEGANKVIEGFDVNFDIDSLSVRINGDGSAMNPAVGQYEFVLADKNFEEHQEDNSLVIRYQEDGGIVYHNPYIRYFPYAKKNKDFFNSANMSARYTSRFTFVIENGIKLSRIM